MTRRVAVVGGGLSGLAAAHRLLELDPSIQVVVFEASARAGGIVSTRRDGPLVLEEGPDSFLTEKPEALALLRRLGLEDSGGAVRAGFVHYNTHTDVDRLLDALSRLEPGGSA